MTQDEILARVRELFRALQREYRGQVETPHYHALVRQIRALTDAYRAAEASEMTAVARDEIIARVIRREGGVSDIGDGKGITRFGQTPGWLTQFNLPIPSDATEAAENYAEWLRLTGLDAVIGDEADAAADFVIDFAVHSGHVPAVKLLQHALKVTADGVMGPKTRTALEWADRRWLAFAVIAGEMQYQGGIITDNPDRHARWARGWANRNAAKLLQLV